MEKNLFLPRKTHLAPLGLFFFLLLGWGSLHATEKPNTAAAPAPAPAKLQEAQLKSAPVEAEQKKQSAVTLVPFEAGNKAHLDFMAHAMKEGTETDAALDQETLDLYMAGFGKGTDSGLFVITTGKECVGWAQILPPPSLIEADMKSWPEKMRSDYEMGPLVLKDKMFRCFENSIECAGIYIGKKFRIKGYASQALIARQKLFESFFSRKTFHAPSYDSSLKLFIPKEHAFTPESHVVFIDQTNTGSLSSFHRMYQETKLRFNTTTFVFTLIEDQTTQDSTNQQPPSRTRTMINFTRFNPNMAQDTAFQEKFKDLLLVDLDSQTFAKILEESKALNNPLVALASTPSVPNTAAAPNIEKENAKEAPPPTTGNGSGPSNG